MCAWILPGALETPAPNLMSAGWIVNNTVMVGPKISNGNGQEKRVISTKMGRFRELCGGLEPGRLSACLLTLEREGGSLPATLCLWRTEMTASDRPVIALTPGDCTGIGPEQIAKV